MRSRPLIAVIAGVLLVFAPGATGIELGCSFFNSLADSKPIVVILTASPGEANAGDPVSFSTRVVRKEGGSSPEGLVDIDIDDIRQFAWDIDGKPGFEVSTGQVPSIGRIYADTGSTRDIAVEVRALRADGTRRFGRTRVRIHPATGPSPGPGEPPGTGDPLAPTARLSVSPNPVAVNKNVTFDASASTDPRNQPLRYLFDLDGDGSLELDNGNNPTITTYYTEARTYHTRVRVFEQGGRADDETVDLVVTPGMGGRALAASRGRRFSARIKLFPIPSERGKLRRHGAIRRWRGAMALGGVRGQLSGPPRRTLTPLLDARWLSRVSITTNSRTGALEVSGLALASSKGAVPSQACLRIRFAGRPGRRARGSFRVLGASGGAAGLAGRGNFGYRVDRRQMIRLRGRVRLGGRSRRAIPRPCKRLEKIRQ